MYGMNVVLLGFLVRQEDTHVMVKLQQYNWTLDTIVEWIVVAKPANPTKVGLGQVLTGEVETMFEGLGREQLMERGDQRNELCSLRRTEFCCNHTLIGNNSIILSCPSKMLLVSQVPTACWHRRIVHFPVYPCSFPQLWRQRLHQLQSNIGFSDHQLCAVMGALINDLLPMVSRTYDMDARWFGSLSLTLGSAPMKQGPTVICFSIIKTFKQR